MKNLLFIDQSIQVDLSQPFPVSNLFERGISTHCPTCCCRTKIHQIDEQSFVLPFEHDYVTENDFDVLVNANHDYYSRILQRGDDELSIDHSYAFQITTNDDTNHNIETSCDDFIINKIDGAYAINFENNWSLIENEEILSSDYIVIPKQPYNASEIPAHCEEIVSSKDKLTPSSSSNEHNVFNNSHNIDHDTGGGIIVEYPCYSEQSELEEIPINPRFNCGWKECKQNFDSVERFLAHFKCKHCVNIDNLSQKCLWCGCKCEVVFMKRYLLERHLKTHFDIKAFICKICQKSYPTIGRLNEHTRRHLGKKSHCCKLCDKSFISKGDFKRHLQTHEKNFPTKYSCKFCENKYKDASGLRKHLNLNKCQLLKEQQIKVLDVLARANNTSQK